MDKRNAVFQTFLKDKLNNDIEVGGVGWEGILLHHKEIDLDMIPESQLSRLPDPLLFEMMIQEGGKGNEWLFGLASSPDEVEVKLYVVCFRNEQRLLKE